MAIVAGKLGLPLSVKKNCTYLVLWIEILLMLERGPSERVGEEDYG